MNNKFLHNRDIVLDQLTKVALWDLIIVGGGATGLGTAVDAASRGYKVLLLEQADFAKGTSSRSTKLVHGGVRYLAQGDVGLVYEALHERGLLLQNAPHLVKRQSFIIPCYSLFDRLKYVIGLKLYDWLAGKFSFGPSKLLSRDEVVGYIDEINTKGLRGGIEYWDGQFDDARLAINLAQTATEQGASLLNYFKVTGLLKSEDGKVTGIKATDTETGADYTLRSKSVINATGVFVDDILKMDTATAKPLVRPSQGVHVVLDRSFLTGAKALMIPKTADGRVLFAVPWHDHVVVGTTDTPLDSHSIEPVALDKEVSFILATAGQYLVKPPSRKDVLSVFAGLRPLAAPDKDTGATKEISRSHKIIVSPSGLLTITGGKWTTYRKMAEDVVDKVIETARLDKKQCVTRSLKIHGYAEPAAGHLNIYGSDAQIIEQLIAERPELADRLDDQLPYLRAEVVLAVRNELARTVEDFLARRVRLLFLNAQAAINIAPAVATIMADELGRDGEWQKDQINAFNALAKQYLTVNKSQ